MKEYRNFIFAKWLRSLRSGNDYFKLIDTDKYFKTYQNYIEQLLMRSFVKLAHLTEDRDVVLGFSVIERSSLHYVYVQKLNRRQGIAREITPDYIDSISHVTKDGLAFWNKELSKAKFNPFV